MIRTRRLLTGLLASGAIAMAGGCGDDGGMGPDPTPDPDDGLPGDVQAGMIQTWAGTGAPGFDGNGNPLLRSRFYWPVDVLITTDGETFVMDWNNHRVRRVTAASTFETVLGTDFIGDGPPDLSDLTQPGAPGTEINLNHPTHMIKLLDGKYLLTSWHNHKLRVWDPVTGYAYVMCGAAPGFADGPVASARLNQPQATVQAADGSLFILDQRNQRVRKIDAAGNVTTVVGSGVSGFAGDGGSALAAEVSFPKGSNPPPAGGLALDGYGSLYFSDILNNRVRRVDLTQDLIETVVGDGAPGFGGDGGPGTFASLNNPRDLEMGPDGRLYIADELNNRVRAYDPATGTVVTVAGTGAPGFSGDDGAATSAQLNRPAGLEFDLQGRLYIADAYNHRIRRMRLEGN